MTVIALPQSDRAIAKAWLRHVAVLAALVGFLLLVFRQAVAAAFQVWSGSPTYSHCFLIVPIVLWLIWERRNILAATAPSLFPQALWAMPLLGLMWWMGQLAAINEVQQYAVAAMMQVIIVALLGLNVMRLIWFPVLYLIFLVPTGEYLIAPMQRFAAHFVEVSLTLLRIPYYSEGTLFELASGRYEIAEACAGLRFLIATVTLAVLFCYMVFRNPIKIALFLVASVAVPLIGNGLRCVGIIVLANFTNNEYGAGADHIVYGWGFNVAILLVLGGVGWLFRDDVREHFTVRTDPPLAPKKLVAISALAAGLICAGPALAFWHDNRSGGADLEAIAAPFAVRGWSQLPAGTTWHPEFFGFDDMKAAAIVPEARPDSLPVDLFLGYYARPRPGHSMTAHINRFWNLDAWKLAESGSVTATVGGKPIQLQEWIINSTSERRMVWSCYWVDGRFTTSLLRVKLWQARAALQGHEGQAVLVLSTQMAEAPQDARGRLSEALAALQSLPDSLDAANRQASARRAGGR